MRNILFVAKEIDTGGILSAVTPIVQQAIGMGLQVDFLNIGPIPEKVKKRLPQTINWTELPQPTRLQRVAAILKSGMLLEKLRTMIDPGRKAAKLGQKIDQQLCKMMGDCPGRYDVAFATGEFLPVYYVATKVIARKKLAELHPRWDLLQLDEDSEVPFLQEMDQILSISTDCKKALAAAYPQFAQKLTVLEYACDAETIKKRAEEHPATEVQGEGYRIVSVCRLDNRSKRIDRMVGAAKILASRNFSFHWTIVGGGPDRESIESAIQKAGVQKNFTLVGNQDNPYPYIKHAQLFVLTSQYEGMPIAVTEAAVLQIPMVLTECVNWSDAIRNRATIVPNQDDVVCAELASAITKSFEQERVIEPYIPDSSAQRKKLEALLGA